MRGAVQNDILFFCVLNFKVWVKQYFINSFSDTHRINIYTIVGSEYKPNAYVHKYVYIATFVPLYIRRH